MDRRTLDWWGNTGNKLKGNGSFSTNPNLDRVVDVFVFISSLFVIGFSILANSPHQYRFDVKWFEWIFNRPVYLSVVVLLTGLMLPWKAIFQSRPQPLFVWVVYFVAIDAYHLYSNRSRVDFNLLYLLLFASTVSVQRHAKSLTLALLFAIAVNALYGAMGMLFVRANLNTELLGIRPLIVNELGRISPGFYRDFTAALYHQSNAAGAIFAASFSIFLYQYHKGESCFRLPIIGMIFAGVGLLLSRAMAPILLTLALLLISIPARQRIWFAIALSTYLAFILFNEGGVLGVNMDYLRHKIDSSARIKIALLADNLSLMTSGSLLQWLVPGTPKDWGTENTFVDIAFQYGLLPTIFFYAYCVIALMAGKPKRLGVLLLAPLLLSVMQNSALPPPVVMILGLSLGCYGFWQGKRRPGLDSERCNA